MDWQENLSRCRMTFVINTQFIMMALSAVFSVLTALLIWQSKRAFVHREEERKYRDARNMAIGNGLCAILRDTLITKCEHYSEKGYITEHGLRNIDLMYDAYHNLGGNGVVTALYKQIKELEVRV